MSVECPPPTNRPFPWTVLSCKGSWSQMYLPLLWTWTMDMMCVFKVILSIVGYACAGFGWAYASTAHRCRSGFRSRIEKENMIHIVLRSNYVSWIIFSHICIGSTYGTLMHQFHHQHFLLLSFRFRPRQIQALWNKMLICKWGRKFQFGRHGSSPCGFYKDKDCAVLPILTCHIS